MSSDNGIIALGGGVDLEVSAGRDQLAMGTDRLLLYVDQWEGLVRPNEQPQRDLPDARRPLKPASAHDRGLDTKWWIADRPGRTGRRCQSAASWLVGAVVSQKKSKLDAISSRSVASEMLGSVSHGRPPGTRNRAKCIADLLRRNVDEPTIGRIIQAMVEKAEAGDVKAAQFLFGPELTRAQQVRLHAKPPTSRARSWPASSRRRSAVR
jgi:hypothetical protein